MTPTQLVLEYAPLWIPGLMVAVIVPIIVCGLRRGHDSPDVVILPPARGTGGRAYCEQ